MQTRFAAIFDLLIQRTRREGVSVKTGISYYKVDLKALDRAYSVAFPKSTSINVNKK